MLVFESIARLQVDENIVTVAGRRDVQAMRMQIGCVEAIGLRVCGAWARPGVGFAQFIVERPSHRLAGQDLDHRAGQATIVAAQFQRVPFGLTERSPQGIVDAGLGGIGPGDVEGKRDLTADPLQG
jgi:hypothetical protein